MVKSLTEVLKNIELHDLQISSPDWKRSPLMKPSESGTIMIKDFYVRTVDGTRYEIYRSGTEKNFIIGLNVIDDGKYGLVFSHASFAKPQHGDWIHPELIDLYEKVKNLVCRLED